MSMSRRIPVSQWNKFHLFPKRATLYKWIKNRKENGMEAWNCVFKVNGVLVLKEREFLDFLESKNELD